MSSSASRRSDDSEASGLTSSTASTAESVEILDGIDEAVFESSVTDMVNQIYMEMREYGDDVQPNDLKAVEFRIQTERIFKLLDACVDNILFGFLLPTILRETENRAVVKMVRKMPERERARLMELIETFEAKPCDEFEAERLELLYQEFERLIKAADKSELRKIVPCFLNRLTPEAQRFLNLLNEFREIARLLISWTAPKAMAKEKRLYVMWSEIGGLRAAVAKLLTQVDVLQKRQVEREELSERIMADHEEKLQQLVVQTSERIAAIIYNSNLKMNKIGLESEARQKEMQKLAQRTKAEYEQMLADNLVTGRKLRENKLKMQQKLQSWLLKYDTDVGGRMYTLWEKRDKWEEENDEYEREKIIFEKQEIEYLRVDKEIMDEWIEERDKKVYTFTRNLAAKKIQRSWRALMKKRRKAAKKRGRGKKGKK